MEVRTRIAPSPTGLLHIGTARTALFNYLFAKKNKGKFLLRIEDTDIARNSDESYQAIYDGLEWLGLKHDETVEYQSRRWEFYTAQLEKLLENGSIYYSYIPDDEIAKRKEKAIKNGTRYLHRYSAEDEIVQEGVMPVLRLKVANGVDVVIDDVVQGKVVIKTDTIEDFVLARSDGTPIYMFVVVCDDIDMRISHVLRGVDHLTNTAKQILLYNAFKATLPVFGHIPLIHGEDGAKLSKRHGAVGVMEYKAQGYLPEAMIAYLVKVGWSNGNNDIMTIDEAIEAFNLEGIGRAAGRFDLAKLQSVNEYFIKKTENSRLVSILESDHNFDFNQIENVDIALNIAKNCSKTLLDVINTLLLLKKDLTQTADIDQEKANIVRKFMSSVQENSNLHDEFKAFLETNGLKFKDIGPVFRTMLIGCASSIAIFDIISAIGFVEAKRRIMMV